MWTKPPVSTNLLHRIALPDTKSRARERAVGLTVLPFENVIGSLDFSFQGTCMFGGSKIGVWLDR
jgi:hypothetical protein